ncbi:hypothetical protein BCV70DRAFT_197222 [Testicularia cyperi]|uniref:Alpha/beta-hydrolase n=1 Tax=Testicularia cyperi TaxID=1882483 RepID=A0A317XXY8_9BASI|nr:hypothetical protein BCV70DRAFT_197222 [Testicularia cyperi]
MVKATFGKAAATLALAMLATSADARNSHRSASKLQSRQSSGSIMQSDYQNGATAPGAQTGDAAGQTIVISSNGGHDDNSQREGCSTIFIGSAAVGGSFSTGWTEMPQVLGFDTMRDLTVSGSVVQPYIMERGKDASKIKRVIIVQPGLPRDYWKYANLMRNSLLCASVNSTMGINREEILIVAPTWLNTDDRSAGAAQENDLLFNGGGWATGSNSRGPGDTSVSSFTVLDMLSQKFLDKSTYPKVGQVVIAGHSLGGSLTQKYAMLRKTDSTNDANMNYFVGNPGSYVWPISDRPVSNPSDTSCASTVNEWGYGLESLPSYGRSGGSTSEIASRYYGRNVIYGLGLSDSEGGDSHCEAQYQGTSHLTRGQNFQRALESANNGNVPSSQIFNYVAGVAHEDYLIFSDPTSQYYLFSRNYNTSFSSTTSSGAATTSSKGSKAGSTGSSSSGSATGSSSSSGSTNGAMNFGASAAIATSLLAASAAVAAFAF